MQCVDAVNKFKRTTASVTSLRESNWQVRPEKSAAIENKLLPTDVADRWQLLGIIKAIKKKKKSSCAKAVCAREFSSSYQGNIRKPPECRLLSKVSVCSLQYLLVKFCTLTAKQMVNLTDAFPQQMTDSRDRHSSAIHVLKLTDQESYGCAASATSEVEP